MLTIDTDARQVWVDDSLIDLTWTEFEILPLLAATPRKCFSKSAIAQMIWERPYFDDGHAIESHMSRLRRKLRSRDLGIAWIITVRRAGYRLEAPITWLPHRGDARTGSDRRGLPTATYV